ncbi:MAG: hypothetical protein HY870_18895 [Chloroflexi bacterium]|nr:hypothetical protein [Chloroflexota bacterium]
MGEIVLHEPLASQLRHEAEAEGLPVEHLIEAALRQYRFQAQRKKLTAEAAWWQSVGPEMQAQFTGEFVAVHQRAVIDHDGDETALRQRVRARFPKTAVLIAPAQGRRELRMISSML